MKIVKFILIFLLSTNLYAQRFDWRGQIGGDDIDSVINLQIDRSGNVYTSGIFHGKVDINQDTTKKNDFTSKGLSDFYIQKTNPFGEFLWGKQFGADSIDKITNVKYFDNKLFIAGQFSKSIKFDNIDLVSKGKIDVFLAALDTAGSVLWAKSYGGGLNDTINTMMVDSKGIVISGIFSGNVFNQTTNGSFVIAKVTLDGSTIEWSKKISDAYKIKPFASEFDSKGNLVFAGSFIGENIDFNPSSTKDSILSSEKIPTTIVFTKDAFILRLTSIGDFISVKKIGGSSGNDEIYGMNFKKGVLAFTGKFKGSVVFGSAGSKVNVSKGDEDIFVACYNENLILNWAVNTGGLKNDFGSSIFIDSNLNVYATGTFFDGGKTVDFGNNFKLLSNSSLNAFIWKLSSAGLTLYAGSFGGSGIDNGTFIMANDEEEIFSTGVFRSTSTFYDKKLTSFGKGDVYLLKSLSEKDNGYVIDYAIEGVNPDSLPFRLEVAKKDIGNLPWYNKEYVLTNTKYTNGDTNTILIDKEQGPVDTTLVPYYKYASKACSDHKVGNKTDWFLPSLEELKLMYKNKKSIGGMKDYPYWCSSETDLNNANSVDFTNGNTKAASNKAERKYVRPVRKKMKNDGLNVNNVISFQITPNPTNGQSLISIDQKFVQNGVNVEIVNMSGQLIHKQQQNQNLINIDLSNYENGLYIIKLYNDSFNGITKVIKE